MSAKNIEVEFIRRLPNLVVVHPGSYRSPAPTRAAVLDILGSKLPKLRVVVTTPYGTDPEDIAHAILTAWDARGVKANPRKGAARSRKVTAKRNPGWHPYEVGGVKHWSKPVPTGGRVVVVEPYQHQTMYEVNFYPGDGHRGSGHYTNEYELDQAKAAGERAINYYSGRSPNKMGKMHRPNPGKRPAARKAAPRRNPHESMTEQQASDTIAALGGMGKLRAMIGADTFIRGYEADGTPSLSFKFKGCKTANYARIALDPSDTYTLRLFKIRGYEAKPVYEASDLYAENLRPAFERATGLYLSLGTMRGNPGKAARKAGRRNPHSIHPYVVFEEWRTTGFPKKHIALLSAASGVDKKEMEQHFGAKGYVYDPESEDDDTLFNEVENGIVERYGMPTAAEYAESRAALKAGGAKAPARSSVKKAPKGPPPLSKFKHHPYLDYSSWESSDYKDQSYLKAISLASGVPLKTLQEGKFGYGAKDDALAARIEGIIVDRYGSPWTDNPRKARARKVAR